MKKIFQVITTVVFVFCFWAQALAAPPSVVDSAYLLNDQQLVSLTKTLNALEKKHDVRIAVVARKSMPTKGEKVGEYANFLLDKHFNDGAKGNMVLVLNMETRDWYVATDVKMKNIISDYGIETIGKSIVPALKNQEYLKAFTEYGKKSDELITYYEENGKPLKEDNWLTIILSALGAGSLITLGAGYTMKSSMSNVGERQTASEYLNQDSFQVRETADLFMYTDITRTAKSKTVSTSSADDKHGGGGGKF